MLNLPTPKLGEIAAFTISSQDLEGSLKYYQRLGFSELFRADWPFPWIQITDGALLIMLRKGDEPYIAQTYYVKDIDTVIEDLEGNGISFEYRSKDGEMPRRYVFKSPDGINISLVNIAEGFTKPEGPTMLSLPQSDYFNPAKYPNQVCGLFGEFAQPVKDLENSIVFWEKLGFKALSRFDAPYPWAILSDGLAIIGLHQTSHFSYPAITYFASDIKEKIERLKQAGLENFTESGGPGNIVLTTPEQQHIFLFKLGM